MSEVDVQTQLKVSVLNADCKGIHIDRAKHIFLPQFPYVKLNLLIYIYIYIYTVVFWLTEEEGTVSKFQHKSRQFHQFDLM